MSDFVKKLIRDLLNSSFCQDESCEAASNTCFLEKALEGGVEYEMIKDCESTGDIIDVIETERVIINSLVPDDDDDC